MYNWRTLSDDQKAEQIESKEGSDSAFLECGDEVTAFCERGARERITERRHQATP
jgi:hypothetical protein